ncbi:MAG TPA: hypothetical protein VGI81_26965 [Tepidisphaeraceae bacterium]|jgi:hypothetical protein
MMMPCRREKSWPKFVGDVPERKRIEKQLDHLVSIGAVRQTEAGYEIA